MLSIAKHIIYIKTRPLEFQRTKIIATTLKHCFNVLTVKVKGIIFNSPLELFQHLFLILILDIDTFYYLGIVSF